MNKLALVERLTPTTVVRPWGTEQTIVRTADYSGKVLRYKAGQAGGLQYHVLKDETFLLLEGECELTHVTSDEWSAYPLRWLRMSPGDAFRFPPFSVHQVRAITDCMGIEFSTPHEDDRVRVEGRYGVEAVEGAGPTTWDVDATGYHARRAVE